LSSYRKRGLPPMDENPYQSPHEPARESHDLRASRNTIQSILALPPRQRAAAIVILLGTALGYVSACVAYCLLVAGPENPKATSVAVLFSLAGAVGGAAVASVGVAVAALVWLLCRRWRQGRGKPRDSAKRAVE
jgi:hypothetical protein